MRSLCPVQCSSDRDRMHESLEMWPSEKEVVMGPFWIEMEIKESLTPRVSFVIHWSSLRGFGLASDWHSEWRTKGSEYAACCVHAERIRYWNFGNRLEFIAILKDCEVLHLCLRVQLHAFVCVFVCVSLIMCVFVDIFNLMDTRHTEGRVLEVTSWISSFRLLHYHQLCCH